VLEIGRGEANARSLPGLFENDLEVLAFDVHAWRGRRRHHRVRALLASLGERALGQGGRYRHGRCSFRFVVRSP
jgi:hypothetical protein